MLKATVNGQFEHELSFESGSAKGNGKQEGTIDGADFLLDMQPLPNGSWSVIRNHRSYLIDILELDRESKTVQIIVNGRKYEVVLKDRYDQLLKNLGLDNLNNAAQKEVKAPMPGMVLDIMVEAGAQVSKGDPLLVLEAMKMENVLKSPSDGVVKHIAVERSVAVEKNQLLVQFD